MERSKDWMDEAEGDLEHAKSDLKGKYYNWACFSAQIYYPKFNKENLIQAIRERLEDLNQNLPLQLVVLFGSYAKGNYTVASDTDLLVVHRGRERKDAYSVIERTLGVPRLEPHVYSDNECEQMKKTINKMIKNGIVLFQS